MRPAFDLSLYLVTDSDLSKGRSLEKIVSEAVEGGVTIVQLREKEMATGDFIALARRLKSALAPYSVPLLINDRVDVALASDADGVHIGQSDISYSDARSLLGDDKIIGLSVENFDEVLLANALDIDYIGISPLHSTPTKSDTAAPFGVAGCTAAAEASAHPTVAIGGINLSNIEESMGCGVDGVAVVSAIISADSPREAARNLRSKIDLSKRVKPKAERVNERMEYCRVLTIAGSDSGGGAGIQADIKAISACGCYAASAITAVTVQNTLGVEAVHPIPLEIIEGQTKAVLSDIGANAIKIGMMHSAEVIEAVARQIEAFGIHNVVVDPVMVSTSGHRLIEESAIEALKERLIPLARVITPNIPEAEILLGERIESQSELSEMARKLSMGGRVSVLLKAGHLTEETLTDILYNAETDEIIELTSRRLTTPNTHGTGCTLSSSLAAMLAKGMELNDAARAAKDYINRAIISGARFKIGEGHGPVDHFFGSR